MAKVLVDIKLLTQRNTTKDYNKAKASFKCIEDNEIYCGDGDNQLVREPTKAEMKLLWDMLMDYRSEEPEVLKIHNKVNWNFIIDKIVDLPKGTLK